MATLSTDRIAALLSPYLAEGQAATKVPSALYGQLSQYLDLLLRWNARTNLTAIRDPDEIVRRHFGESLFAGMQLAPQLAPDASLLDFGSGAGFPGLPIQLLLPGLRVTLAESQGKKATFLREAVRSLGLPTEVWADRVSALPSGRSFDVVALRAVDAMEQALADAKTKVASGGLLVTLSTESTGMMAKAERIPLPAGAVGCVNLLRIG